jgi:hypothetical protein
MNEQEIREQIAQAIENYSFIYVATKDAYIENLNDVVEYKDAYTKTFAEIARGFK